MSAKSALDGAKAVNLGQSQTQREPPPLRLSSPNTENLAENPVQTTIPYTYDSLYRLTDAVYSNGFEFHYTYDPVGNRLTQTTCAPNVPCATTHYQYDDANRLIAAEGGVAYTWDDAGNLLNDGTSTYSYDSQNRLKTLTQGGHTYAFSYNGQGDRLTQSADGVTTRYTLDLEAGLTQVLSDGGYTYLYGNDKVAQAKGSEKDYFLGDAVDSVRQLTDEAGVIKQSQNYEPYGSVMGSIGNSQSEYQYTGEMQDATGLVYLRARYYNPRTGTLLSPDPLEQLGAIGINRYPYARQNPIRLTDASGMSAQQAGGGLGSIAIDCSGPNLATCEQILAAGGTVILTVVSAPEIVAGAGLAIIVLGAAGMVYLLVHYPPEAWPQTLPKPAPAPAPPTTWPKPRTSDDIAKDGGSSRQPAPQPEAPQPPPQPKTGPDPWVTRPCTPEPPKTATATPEPRKKHISLGLNYDKPRDGNPILFWFTMNLNQKYNPENIDVYSYGSWEQAGLSGNLIYFQQAFNQATQKAEKIHFNLEAIQANWGDPVSWAEKYGPAGFPGAYFTAVELYQIRHNSKLCREKTSFYTEGSKNVDTPSEEMKNRICTVP